ncbi:MAG: hypothetical protein RJA22_2491 [Verrucomicrobiota bacterium]
MKFPSWCLLPALCLALLPATASAQNGDKKGEVQVARVPKEKIPPSPPLKPEQALQSFKLQPGHRIELVAAEPLLDNPVVAQFDPDGRLWVVEMVGYMPDADGIGEDQKNGRIIILEDQDGDGRAETRKVFLDGLVMPRALLHVQGGVLVGEPPNLWFYPVQGDQPGPRVQVASDFGSRINPEHTANSLLLSMDNWIYSLYHPWRYRHRAGRWEREPAPQRVQWGQAMDDFGRLYYTSNSDFLRGDALPPHYFAGFSGKSPGLSVPVAKDQSVWPARVNPGVNRGYQPDTLRPDGTLAKFTAACGTLIYRGDALPEAARGSAFVCEPAGNLVRRATLSESNGLVSARNAYKQSEFLTSTDELFRPVNVLEGPDGALYVIDMYRGIIQHRVYLTTYLRTQAEERGLENVVNRGRIWRITGPDAPRRNRPALAKASSTDLVQALSHRSGWWRDTAQRLLVERGDAATVPALRQLASSTPSPITRLHALWTLEGMQQLADADIQAALADPHPKVRTAGLRLAEPRIHPTNSVAPLREPVLKLAKDPAAEVQAQLALTLAQNRALPQALGLLASMSKQASTPLARDMASYLLTRRDTPKATAATTLALSPAEKKHFDSGRAVYEQVCLACHQDRGQGQPGLAPPLAGSEWVGFSDQRLIRILLQGLRGKIKVSGEDYEMDMPGLGVLPDDQIADVLTYIRRDWGHNYPPVSAATVKQVRQTTETRNDSWTQADLMKIP